MRRNSVEYVLRNAAAAKRRRFACPVECIRCIGEDIGKPKPFAKRIIGSRSGTKRIPRRNNSVRVVESETHISTRVLAAFLIASDVVRDVGDINRIDGKVEFGSLVDIGEFRIPSGRSGPGSSFPRRYHFCANRYDLKCHRFISLLSCGNIVMAFLSVIAKRDKAGITKGKPINVSVDVGSAEIH